jgi:hypothetical protein
MVFNALVIYAHAPLAIPFFSFLFQQNRCTISGSARLIKASFQKLLYFNLIIKQFHRNVPMHVLLGGIESGVVTVHSSGSPTCGLGWSTFSANILVPVGLL